MHRGVEHETPAILHLCAQGSEIDNLNAKRTQVSLARGLLLNNALIYQIKPLWCSLKDLGMHQPTMANPLAEICTWGPTVPLLRRMQQGYPRALQQRLSTVTCPNVFSNQGNSHAIPE
mmetsp:Transcript_157551/g.277993  ORF Transcript_157551/g.277993 Transcript_157551/m.277993 type:complete len:118 (+) Transcript_157551:48-401(+)